eukprot:1192180-Prorocentrum_minimum.AAC.4
MDGVRQRHRRPRLRLVREQGGRLQAGGPVSRRPHRALHLLRGERRRHRPLRVGGGARRLVLRHHQDHRHRRRHSARGQPRLQTGDGCRFPQKNGLRGLLEHALEQRLQGAEGGHRVELRPAGHNTKTKNK